MKKAVLMGIGGLLVSLNTYANSDLYGRYALDCSKEKAHNLSYVVGEKSIIRLISAKQKHADFKMEQLAPKEYQDYQYLVTRKYDGFKVEFYQKDVKNFAHIKSTSLINIFGPKTQELLVQCPVEIVK